MSVIFTSSYFFWGALLLFIGTAVFYLVSFGFLWYWRETKANFIIVPLLLTFEFFIVGFFIVGLLSILLSYAPDIINALIAINNL